MSSARPPLDLYRPEYRSKGYWRDGWDAWFGRGPGTVWCAPAGSSLTTPGKFKATVSHPRKGFYLLGSKFQHALPMPMPTTDYGMRLRLRFSGKLRVFTLESDDRPLPIWLDEGGSGLFWAAYDVGREVDCESALEIEVVQPATGDTASLGESEWCIKHFRHK